MARELSYVIACLQEIELAVAELKTIVSPDQQKDLESLSVLIRNFFQGPGRVPAERIQEALQKHRDASARWMQQTLVVDNLSTTLSGLSDELTEVLEDLD